MEFGKPRKPTKFFCINTNLIWELPVSGNSVKVLGFLKAQRHDFNFSIKRIAERTLINRSTVARCLVELEEKDLIRMEKFRGETSHYSFAPDDAYNQIILTHAPVNQEATE